MNDYELLAEHRIEELKAKLEAIKRHFKKHECLYRFDFNILMDEVDQSSR